MDISNPDSSLDRLGDAANRLGERAQVIVESERFFPGRLTPRTVAIGLAAVGGLIGVAAASYYGVPTSRLMGQSLATENALTYYSAAAGLAGFFGSFIAAQRLAGLDRDAVTVVSLTAPVIVTVVGNAAAGFLFPTQ